MPKPGPNVHKKDTDALTEVICEMCAQRHSKPRCPHCGHKPNRTKRDR